MIQRTERFVAAAYEEIETAVMETERGRWFLDEFARRRRAEDTTRILAAIHRLEAKSAEAEAAETRARLDTERSLAVLRELAELLRELRPARDALAMPPWPARIAAAPPGKLAGDLEARLAALANMDESKLERFS